MSSRHRGEIKVKVYPYSTNRRLYHHERRKEVGLTSEPVWMDLKIYPHRVSNPGPSSL
jgi:hypothetical protein